jgi:hypothetical protein
MPFVIDAMAALGPLRCRQDADGLEIADRFDVNAGAARQLPASDAFEFLGPPCRFSLIL